MKGKCGGCGQGEFEAFTAYALVIDCEMDNRSQREVDEGVDFVTPVCTPHCLFDLARKRLESDRTLPVDSDSLIAIAFDLLAALDGFGANEEGTATDAQWAALNESHERLGILLSQFDPPDIAEYLSRDL